MSSLYFHTARFRSLFSVSSTCYNYYFLISRKIIDNYLEHFYKTAQSSSICDFYNNLENSIYHVELRKALSLIHEHKYQGALDYLKDKGEGIFKNGDVSINNAIREYCINQLS